MAAKGLGARMKKLTIPDVDPDKPYPMTKPKLGKAVIVNNVHSQLPGSRVDVEALQETYGRIGLEVEVHNDCEKTKMARIKRKILKSEMHEDSNMFVLSVICHGNNQGHLLDVDRKRAWVTEDILSDLSFVETLVGKPKLLVLQSCRGSERSPGTPFLADDLDMDPVTLPDKSDMFVAYATVPGYIAHAGDEDGSAFIQGFSAYLERHFQTHDLDAIYSMVNQYMAGVEQGESADKQVSEKRSSLRFPLRFSEFKGKSQGIPKRRSVVTPPSAPKQKLDYPAPPPAPLKGPQPPPTAGSRPPPAGAQPPPTGVQPPPGGAKPPPAGAQQPAAGAQPPPAGAQQPPARTQPPPAGVQPPPAGAQQPQRVTQLNIRLLSTYDTGMVQWGKTDFTMMETGHIVLWGKSSKESPLALHIFLQDSEGFKKVSEVKGFCEHEDSVFLEPMKVKDQEFLAVSCARCRKIRLYDMNREEVTTAFYNPMFYPGFISAGEEGVMYVLCFMVEFILLKLNTEQIPFTGPHATIQSGVKKLYSMVYRPAPHNLLVFSDHTPAIIRAVSSITGEEKWELRGEVDGRKCQPHGMFFSQDHQVLLVADGWNSRILVLNPTDGLVINTIQLDDEMGAIVELCIQKQKLIVRHKSHGKYQVSIFSTY